MCRLDSIQPHRSQVVKNLIEIKSPDIKCLGGEKLNDGDLGEVGDHPVTTRHGST